MIIGGKYEASDVVADGRIRTFLATHKPLGNSVMVHLLSARADTAAVMERLKTLPDSDRQLFIDVGQHEEATFLVSRILTDFDNLGNWLDRRGPAQTAPSATIQHEFEKAFGVGSQETALPARVDPAPRNDPGKQGEFTAWFRRPGRRPSNGASPAEVHGGQAQRLPSIRPPAKPSAESRPVSAPGSVPAVLTDRPAPSNPNPTGAITEFFRTSTGKLFGSRPRTAPVGSESQPVEMPPSSRGATGEYTRMISSKQRDAIAAPEATGPARPSAPEQKLSARADARYLPMWICLAGLVAAAIAVVVLLK